MKRRRDATAVNGSRGHDFIVAWKSCSFVSFGIYMKRGRIVVLKANLSATCCRRFMTPKDVQQLVNSIFGNSNNGLPWKYMA